MRWLRDRDLQLIGIHAVAVVPLTVPLGYADYQLSFYRNVIYLGLLLGILMRLPALDEPPAEAPFRAPVDSTARMHAVGVLAHGEGPIQ